MRHLVDWFNALPHAVDTEITVLAGLAQHYAGRLGLPRE